MVERTTKGLKKQHRVRARWSPRRFSQAEPARQGGASRLTLAHPDIRGNPGFLQFGTCSMWWVSDFLDTKHGHIREFCPECWTTGLVVLTHIDEIRPKNPGSPVAM